MGAVLGRALEPRQLAITAASAAFWQFVAPRFTPALAKLIIDEEVWKKCNASQRKRISNAMVVASFSTVATLFAAGLLLRPPHEVAADPIYGISQHTQNLMAIASGFFAWNLATDEFSLPNIAHHTSCLLLYFTAQYPFVPRMGSVCLLWEASTPPACVFNVLKTVDLEKTEQYIKARKVFSAAFILARILIGMPSSAFWWRDMIALLSGNGSRTPHSVPMVYGYMGANLLLNGLNFYWFVLIMKGIVAHAKRNKGNGKGQ